ncbi:sigma-54 dependent transcriptional regulator [Chitinivorax sp. B]|uniref:sigma-54-dependent transcriptional regulator n=1 Tax=Chitinivorax sp. B TaxID=2502235 RepID=UPI0010F88024|nr:sigma-54 dependent transcriptional regulator [Chitinivorax sp. B]
MAKAGTVVLPHRAVLLVDDDPLIAESLQFVLRRRFDVTVANTVESAMAAVRAMPVPPALALVDLGLPPDPHSPTEGYRLITELLAFAPEMKIVVLSGQNDEAHARHARVLGAIEFVAKPCAPDLIEAALQRGCNLLQWEQATEQTSVEGGLIGDSSPIRKLRMQIRQYASAPFPVLVVGESGTGKELVARSLHDQGTHADRPYLVFNCAAIAPSLVEAALFGHSKGAFTGAIGGKAGFFEGAGEGTLFLDEIGELPMELQAKLLRVLETGDFQRVGETQPRFNRARVLAATNRDLREESRHGRFRVDLYHRLSVFTIEMPTLRTLGPDKLLLMAHFRERYAEQAGMPPFELSDECKQAWLDYSFPGNVRELRNIVIRLIARYPGRTLNQAELLPEFELTSPPPDPQPVSGSHAQVLSSQLQQAMKELQRHPDFHLDKMLKEWERCYIDAAMKLAGGNVSQAAKLLGINRTTLYGRLSNEDKRVSGGAG